MLLRSWVKSMRNYVYSVKIILVLTYWPQMHYKNLNDSIMGESFYQKDSLITHIMNYSLLIMIFSIVANFGNQFLYFYQWRSRIGWMLRSSSTWAILSSHILGRLQRDWRLTPHWSFSILPIFSVLICPNIFYWN